MFKVNTKVIYRRDCDRNGNFGYNRTCYGLVHKHGWKILERHVWRDYPIHEDGDDFTVLIKLLDVPNKKAD